MEPIESRDPALRRAFWCVLAIGLALGAYGFFSVRRDFAYGVWAGSAVVLVNFAILARSVQNLLTGAGGRWGAVVVLKFVGLIAVTYLLLGLVAVDPLGLALGFGTLPLGIVVGSAFGSSSGGRPGAVRSNQGLASANQLGTFDSAHTTLDSSISSSVSSSVSTSSSTSHSSS